MANEKAPETPQKQRKRLAVKEDTLLIAVIKRYFKYAGAALAIWGFGYTQLSPAWILLGLVGIVWKEKHQKLQQKKIEISQQAAKNEKEAILARVFFPDVERAEWMNKIIDQMWPFIGDYVQQLLMTSVQKTVQDSASIMGSFKFVNIDLGDIPPRIGGVKVYTEKVKRDEIYMDLDIIYSSDCEIEVKIKGISAGIKDLQLHGTVRVIMKPLISQSPFFGGLSVFFLNNPSIDFNLTNLANALDLPGLSDMLHTIIQENIANIMVLPNRIVVEMAKGVQITKLKFPQPDGVMRIHVLEAKELKKADISLTGKGKSDPYSTIIDERDGQFMDIEVRDEDTGGKDDKLGTVSVELSPVADKGTIDNWLPLENVKSGKLHLRLVWLYLSKDPLILNKSLQSNKNDSSGALGHDLSSCILMVSLDSARELPRISQDSFYSRTKKMAEPSPYVTINVGQKTETSNIVNDSTEPRWEQGFRFLVFDKKSDKSLGELSFPLKNLLTAPDLEVLTTEQSPEWSQETENLMSPTADAQETNVDEGVTPISKPKVSQVSSDPNAGIKPATAPTNIGPIVSEKSGNVKGQIIPPAKSPGPARESEVRQRNTSTSGSLQGSHGVGRIQLTLRYSMQRGKLMVVVHKCTGLLACDKDNFSDPYVKMYLLPDKSSSSKRKTKYSITTQEMKEKQLEVTVKNDTSLFSSSQKELGVVIINLANMDVVKATTEWYDLCPEEMTKKETDI
ncbi:ESYT2-like protein [Mya arenaria]|uniref:ESYT2-like protein n=1 Tax=Mya arenaria TaxID=6604 RepID=A0ABY7E7Z9_MYAAR|nr:ESYT2-like protein [Mya arenaria]